VIGFVAFTENINSLYKSIILKKGIKFAFLLAGKVFSWARIKKIFETLFYPSRIKADNLPDAELISIAVSEKAKGKGIASQLVERGITECEKRGIDRVKVLVGANLVAANKLYLKCGFEKVGEMVNHGVANNIYIRRIK
jgi:ribosomal protein S18 acetylase RimI-like enzyme